MNSSLYFVAAVAALSVAIRRKRLSGSAGPPMWFVFCAFLAALGTCRLFDVHQILQRYLREQIAVHGLYEQRHILQAVGLVVAVALGGACWIYAMRSRLLARASDQLALMSLLLIVALAAARILSLHSTDSLFNFPLGQFRSGQILEAVLLSAFIICAVLPAATRSGAAPR